jgi:transposase
MADPHPIELRERVVQAHESGAGSYPEVAAQFSVGEASVKRWVWLFQKQGSVAPRAKRGGTPSTIGAVEIERLIARLRDPTAGELTAAFNRHRRRRERVHVSSIKRALHRYGYVVKKSADGRWRVCGRTSSRNGGPS